MCSDFGFRRKIEDGELTCWIVLSLTYKNSDWLVFSNQVIDISILFNTIYTLERWHTFSKMQTKHLAVWLSGNLRWMHVRREFEPDERLLLFTLHTLLNTGCWQERV